MKKAIVILLFLFSAKLLAQTNELFDHMYFIHRDTIVDTLLMEEVPAVSVGFTWGVNYLRVSIYDDSTTTLVTGFDLDIEDCWQVELNGGYFIFTNEIDSDLSYRVWYCMDERRIVQVVAINEAAKTAMLFK